ncbi:MAG: M67 family metallopeptidase [Roseofilum sp. SID1]|uniref:M67 family metallopeptidase n=1 Tax=Roseofilum sp. SID1 TaxID=2821497 RepID=UPI001B1B4447|nr:M67 family metallopeptidase [Roseofilum sp. SID1]MBP0038526.1 M67 family metallopeptidase [Roseofilum sp. SID1]
MQVKSEHLEIIHAHAQECYPQECCGVLLGRVEEDKRVLVEVVRTENGWNEEMAEQLEEMGMGGKTKLERYTIAPQTLLTLQKDARSRHLQIVGFYHSHPDHPAVPSECDRLLAWPDYHYIIVSVIQGRATVINDWVLDRDRQFQPSQLENILNTDTHG